MPNPNPKLSPAFLAQIGTGRPRKYRTAKTLNLDADAIAVLEKLALEQGLSASDAINRIVREWATSKDFPLPH